MSETITGYYIEIPEGATDMGSVNSEEINQSFEDYALSVGATYTAETATHYGTFEWGADPEIESVDINGSPVAITPLIGGAHAPTRPK